MTRREVETRLDLMAGKTKGTRYVSRRTGKPEQ